MPAEDRVIQDVGEPDFFFTGEEVAQMRGPIVYLWTRGPDVLYVGMSGVGLSRPLTTSHEYLRDFQPGDVLRVWRSGDPATLEDALLYHLRPQLNRTKPVYCPYCGAYLGTNRHCRQPGHAPDPSFFVPAVRTNVARRPDHAVRILRDDLYPETSPGEVLPTRLPSQGLAHPTPEQVDRAGDVAVSCLGRNQGHAADANTQIEAVACPTCRIRPGHILGLLNEALTLLEPETEPSR